MGQKSFHLEGLARLTGPAHLHMSSLLVLRFEYFQDHG